MPWLSDYLKKTHNSVDNANSQTSQPLGQSTREGYVFTDKQGNKTIVKPFDEDEASKQYEQQKQKILSKYQNNPNVDVREHNGKITAIYKNRKGEPVYVEETSIESKQSYVNRARAQHLSAVAKFKPEPMKAKAITKTVHKERPASGVISEKPYHGESLFPPSSASPTQKQFQTIHAVHTYISSAEATAIQRAQHAENRKEWLLNAGKAAVLAPANIVTGLADIPGQIYFKLHKNEPATFYTYKANIAKSAPEMFALEAGEGFVASSVANVHAISAELSPAVVEQRQMVTIEKRVATPQMETVYGKAQTVTKADVGFGHSTITSESEFVKSIPKSDNLISERSFAVAGKRGSISTVAYSEKANSVPIGSAKISYSERIGSGIASDIDTFSDKSYSFVSKSIGVESGGRGQFFEAGKLRSGFGTTKYSKYTLLDDETFTKRASDIHISTTESAGGGNPTNFKAAGGFPNSFVSPVASPTSLTKADKISQVPEVANAQSLADIATARNVAVAKNIATAEKIESSSVSVSTMSMAMPSTLPKSRQGYETIEIPKSEMVLRPLVSLKPSIRVESMQGEMPSVATVRKTIAVQDLKSGVMPSLKEVPSLSTAEIVETMKIQEVKMKMTPKIEYAFNMNSSHPNSPSPISEVTVPAPTLFSSLGNSSDGKFLWSLGSSHSIRRSFKYTPSLFAELFNKISFKKPKKIFSGFEIRPIIKKKHKKTKRGAKR